MFYVYILRSEKDKSLYIGYSPDLRARLIKHNKKQVASTKDKVPWKLIYYEAYVERKDATGRERFLKSHEFRTSLSSRVNEVNVAIPIQELEIASSQASPDPRNDIE